MILDLLYLNQDETLVKNNSDLVAERPQENDLVYFPTTTFFEIQFVEHEQPFYQQIRSACLQIILY